VTSSAILFLIFNRPELTARVFDAIRRAQPPRLYVAADGPRDGAGEEARCDEARRIATVIDWPCELHMLFRDTNLGCRHAVSDAIDWFFEFEAEGIILEDDCLPAASFFPYCDELLDRYRDDDRVMSICGSNALEPPPGRHPSYFFSRHCRVWGWATWARAWRLYDVDMAGWPAARDAGLLRDWSSGERRFERYWTAILDRTERGEIGTWDYQWMFACWAHGGLAVRPWLNMISNIGFGADATHTLDPFNDHADADIHEMPFPLIHPVEIARDVAVDREIQAVQFARPMRRWHLRRRVVGKIRRMRKAAHRRRIEREIDGA
jgi:hypothetical protein